MHESIVKKPDEWNQTKHRSTKKKIQVHLDKTHLNRYAKNSSLILRKTKCACDGGCPSCTNESIIQTKLKISHPNDEYEKEADTISEKIINRAIFQCPKSCSKKKEEKFEDIIYPKQKNEQISHTKSDIENNIPISNNGGQSLPTHLQRFYSSNLNYDFSSVMMHTDSKAAKFASSINARAFTKGQHIYFGAGEFSPKTESGKKLIAHELVHIIQQQKNLLSTQNIFRVLDPSMCATGTDCLIPDETIPGSPTIWELKLGVDREGTGISRLFTGDVGHTWVKLRNPAGDNYSFGFYPQIGYSGKKPWQAVDGCVHHPDKRHEPPNATEYKDYSYVLTEMNFLKGLAHAQSKCSSKPNYKFFSYNCTTFAIDVAKAAGVSPPSSTTLSVHNPNALYAGIEKEENIP